jgi:hypothetical protein
MWFDIIKNQIHEDIPDEYIQEGIQSFVETELGDSIRGRKESTLEYFWEEFDEVTEGNVDARFTPEMVISMPKFWRVILQRVGLHLLKEYDMYNWYEPSNNALLQRKVSEAVAVWLNDLDRKGMRRLE